MARLAVSGDSEEEFPDLKDLLKGGTGKKTAPPPNSTTNLSTRRNLGKERIVTKEEEDIGDEEMEEREKGKLSLKVGERSVKKKRVLGKRDDNPLLRPIGRSAREERVKCFSTGLFDSGSLESSKIKSTMKPRKIGEKPVPKGAKREVGLEEDREEVEGARGLKVEEPKKMAPSFELSRARGREVKTTKQKQSSTRGRKTQGEPAPETYSLVDDDSDQSPKLKAFSTRTSREPSIELYGTSKGSKVCLKPQDSTKPTGKGTAKSAPITIDSDDNVSFQVEDSEDSLRPKPSKSKRRREPPPKTKSKFILTDTEEEDSPEEDDSDGMSDFIVSDNELVEDGEDGEDDSVFEVLPPATRSARKLFRGRKPRMSESEDEGLDLKMGKLRVDDDDDDFGDLSEECKGRKGESPTKPPAKDSRKEPPKDSGSMKPPPRREKETQPPSSDIEDPFTLRFSPSENKRKVSKETRFTTPPSSPKLKPRALPSPAKLPRIPTSPHRQSSDDFWSQDVVNDWNDSYSPRKTPAPTLKHLTLGDGKLLFSPEKSSIKPDRLNKDAKKAFSLCKHKLAESFLKELDEKITNGKIAEMAAETGGVKILWSKKLSTTAGRANWKRETIRSCTNPPSLPRFRHHAAIELAEKVIDDQDRLLNVIAHEFCHLANFMVSNIRTNPHGKEFKAWAEKVGREFGERGIEVTTKHSYEIEYKFVWECENCGREFGRHSRSIDPVKHRCGVCKSLLVQTKPVPKDGGGLSSYQAFVKENMRLVREENPGSPQKEIMGLVGKKYQEFKAGKLKETSGSGKVGSKESSPVDDDVGAVVRKLDFLDLTSP